VMMMMMGWEVGDTGGVRSAWGLLIKTGWRRDGRGGDDEVEVRDRRTRYR
jgi:hypothetical protein